VNEDKSTRFRRAQRRLQMVQMGGVLAALWAAAVPDWTGLTAAVLARLQAFIELPAMAVLPAADVIVISLTGLLVLACAAPAAWAREVLLEGRYGPAGVAQAPGASWTVRYVRRGLLLWAAALPFWLLFQQMSRVWPLATVPVVAAALVTAGVCALVIAPWLVTWSPRVVPLRDEALTGRLHALVSRAGLRVAGLHEWRLGESAAEPNAAVIGIGRGRRLLLSDALVETCSPEEIEVVVAHELGHHVEGHIWRRMQSAALVLVLVVAAAQVTAAGVGWWTGVVPGDASLIPVAALAGAVVWLAARPRLLAQSRAHERAADRYSLELTGRADMFERLLLRLAARLRTPIESNRIDEAFFMTHPPISERITLARAWRTLQPSPPAGAGEA
jgi:STE24 endopeptidase